MLQGPVPETREIQVRGALLAQESQGRMQYPLPGEGCDRVGPEPLAQFLPTLPGGHRVMCICGRRQVQAALNVDLPGGGFKQVRTAHHFADRLKGIVDDYGKLVGGQTVRAPDHKVAHRVLQVLPDCSLNCIFEADRLGRRAQPDRAGLLAGRQPVPTGAGIHAGAGQFGAAAAAPESQPALQQFVAGCLVGRSPLALVEHHVVRLHAEPLQVSYDPVGTAGHFARRIDIVHA